MGLFTNYKKVNETNKQQIIKIIDRILNQSNSSGFLNDLNAIKNNLINQAPSDSKSVKEIDEQIIASLVKANELIMANNVSQAGTYIQNAKNKIASRVSSASASEFKNAKNLKLDEEQLMDILLNEAQDKVRNAAGEYNRLKAMADAGDIAAKSKLTFVYQKFQIAQQNFTAISNDQNRANIASLAKTLTEEQKRRIAERKFSDEEFSVIMNQYAEISATIAQEGNDVLTATNTISAVTGALNQNQQDINQAMAMGAELGATDFGANGLPNSIDMPGVEGASVFGGQTSPNAFNPFAKQDNDSLSKYSTNQLNGTVNLLTRQIEDKEDKLAELKSERSALDKKMEKLLKEYQALPPAKAKVLEAEIRSAKSQLDSSNFQLNNVNQELIQLNNNLSMVQKMLSLKDRANSSKAVDQTMGGKLDLKGLSMDIANQVNKNNEKLQLSEDVNVVSNADNIEFGTGTIDFGTLETGEKSNEFDDLMKMYNINGENKQ